jgi:hypothetical protein
MANPTGRLVTLGERDLNPAPDVDATRLGRCFHGSTIGRVDCAEQHTFLIRQRALAAW